MGYSDMFVFFMDEEKYPIVIKCFCNSIPESRVLCGYSDSCDNIDCKCFDELVMRTRTECNFEKLPVRKNMMLMFIIINNKMVEFDLHLPRELIMLIMFQ